MKLIRPYTPGVRDVEQIISHNACHVLGNFGFPVENHRVTDKMRGYEELIAKVWGKDDLVIIEHDIVPVLSDVTALLRCPHPVCVSAHYLYPVSAGVPHPVLAHRKWVGERIEWIEHEEEWADIVSLGLIKITKDVQEKCDITPLEQGRWHSIDIRLSDILREALAPSGIGTTPRPFHVHYPIVEHRHFR